MQPPAADDSRCRTRWHHPAMPAPLRPTRPPARTSGRRWLLLAAVLPAAAALAQPESPWLLRHADPDTGTQVWLRDRGDQAPAFRASTRVAARLSSLAALLLDSERLPAWVYRTRSVQQLQQDSAQQGVSLVVTAMPWPLDDRESVVAWRLQQSASTQVITLSGRGVEPAGQPWLPEPAPGRVRMPSFASQWVFAPVAGSAGQVDVVFEGHATPAAAWPRRCCAALSSRRSGRRRCRRSTHYGTSCNAPSTATRCCRSSPSPHHEAGARSGGCARRHRLGLRLGRAALVCVVRGGVLRRRCLGRPPALALALLRRMGAGDPVLAGGLSGLPQRVPAAAAAGLAGALGGVDPALGAPHGHRHRDRRGLLRAAAGRAGLCAGRPGCLAAAGADHRLGGRAAQPAALAARGVEPADLPPAVAVGRAGPAHGAGAVVAAAGAVGAADPPAPPGRCADRCRTRRLAGWSTGVPAALTTQMADAARPR